MAALTRIFRLTAGASDNFLHRNALAAAVREPSVALAETATILIRNRLIVGRSRRQGAGNGISHYFQ
jgi:hypothetical protein